MTVRIIKKYPNRRLYDTYLKAYITLNDVKKLVLDKVEFKIVDAKNGKDLTQSTLLQILFEEEATFTPIFTTELLQQLIRFYNENSQAAFTHFLEQAMILFMQQKELFKNQIQTFADPDLMNKMMEMSARWSETFLKTHNKNKK